MPLVFGILVSAAVIFAVFAVTIGRGGSMTNFVPDRPGRPLPEDRVVRAHDIGAARFSLAFRGYRMAEVDDALDRLAIEIAERDEAIEKLTGQPFEPLVPRGTLPSPAPGETDAVEQPVAAGVAGNEVAGNEVAGNEPAGNEVVTPVPDYLPPTRDEVAHDDPGTEI